MPRKARQSRLKKLLSSRLERYGSVAAVVQALVGTLPPYRSAAPGVNGGPGVRGAQAAGSEAWMLSLLRLLWREVGRVF